MALKPLNYADPMYQLLRDGGHQGVQSEFRGWI